jgi:hypothetical protein
VAEPTIAETARLMRRLISAGTVRRLDLLHEALCTAYRTGGVDETLRHRDLTECESCLEG